MHPIKAHEDSDNPLERETNEDDNVVFALLKTPNFKGFFDLLGFGEDAWFATTTSCYIS